MLTHPVNNGKRCAASQRKIFPLPSTRHCGYSGSVTEKNVTGIDSPNQRRTRRHRRGERFFAPTFPGGIFASAAQHCSLLGGGVRGAARLAGSVDRSINPHTAALFAFDSATGGSKSFNGEKP